MSLKNIYLKYDEVVPRKKITKGTTTKSSPETIEEIPSYTSQLLGKFFPPIETEEGGHRVKFKVSIKQATASEIADLHKKFEQTLENKITGFSSHSKTACKDLLQELIRQEVIDCPERGLLLRSIHNEMMLTMESMENCYKSSFAYGVCKGLLTDKSIQSMQKEIPELRSLATKLEEDAKNICQNWQEKMARIEHADQIEIIQRNFLENQLTEVNNDIVTQLVKKYDPEKKWLKYDFVT